MKKDNSWIFSLVGCLLALCGASYVCHSIPDVLSEAEFNLEAYGLFAGVFFCYFFELVGNRLGCLIDWIRARKAKKEV